MVLDSIIRYAYDNVPFYIDIRKKNVELDTYLKLNNENELDLNKFPIISKKDIQDGISMESIEYAFLKQDDIIKAFTSGSTGNFLEISWDKYDFNKSLLPLWIYRLKYYHIRMNDKFCYFYTFGNSEETRTNANWYEYSSKGLGFSKDNLTDERFKEIYNMMCEFEPVWMNLQPSIGVLLVDYIKRNNLPSIDSIKYIEFTGEMLMDSLRNEIQEVFHCQVANQYGCNEGNSIAFECPSGNMHCMEESVYVEIVDDDGKIVPEGVEGNVVITTLKNHAMPFIRYQLGDLGIVRSNVSCKCGNHSKVFELLSGRVNEYISLRNQEKLNAYIFVRAIQTTNIYLDNIIKQFQIIQEDYNQFTVRFVTDNSLANSSIQQKKVEDLFLKSINEEKIENATYKFEYNTEYFNEMKSDKHKYFINKLMK